MGVGVGVGSGVGVRVRVGVGVGVRVGVRVRVGVGVEVGGWVDLGVKHHLHELVELRQGHANIRLTWVVRRLKLYE